MEKIIMLGTGHGTVLDLYNTCFVIQNENGNFLVDTGGSFEISRRLKKFNIDYLKDIKHIFISHTHTDHIFGLIWMLKKIGIASLRSEMETKINIYCNDEVYKAIVEISKYVLPEKLFVGALSNIDFHILNDEEKIQINGIDYTFFDLNARSNKQFGFECIINKKRLMFLGDETLKPSLYERVRGTEETHGNERKKLYTQEAQESFKGNVYVPDDLEIIEI